MTSQLIEQAKSGFATVKVSQKFQDQALTNLQEWLTSPEYQEAVPQLEHLINAGHWDYLLDCFYQLIPFGTGGRRGEVGIGTNRINQWTINDSAQGHAQYLLKQYGEDAKTRGVVLAWDVRQFYGNKYYNPDLPNPVLDLDGPTLAKSAASVYAANGIKVYMFDDIRTTPELSFAVRHLNAVSGDVFSASHNPPAHNGKKIYDEYGGQLIPPDDEALVQEVTQNVDEIKTMDFDEAKAQDLIKIIGTEVDQAFIAAATSVSLSDARDIIIAYTPMHGCSHTSVLPVLEKLGFKVQVDPQTSNPSGKFEHVTFNIPNPEVIQSFDTPLKFANQINADILLNTDPDADRIGIMVKHADDWTFLNGNEIGAILAAYVASKRADSLNGQGIMIKTAVTTNVIREICKKYDFQLIGELLVGFKYIGEEMNKIEKDGHIDNFLFGIEESHGYIAGNYVRDKDATVAAIWLAELAAELKSQSKTLVDYLNQVYAEYGYFGNYLTEIRLPGAEGRAQIDSIQEQLRSNPPTAFGEFIVEKMEDYQDRTPILSDTDSASKNVLAFHITPVEGTISIRATVRPSGTEPKTKLYIEIGSQPYDIANSDEVRANITQIIHQVEKAIMKYMYKLIGVDFPDRGFLLFWQLPLQDKLHYFEIEDQIAALKDEADSNERQAKLDDILAFLGSDPIMKIDQAFQAKYNQPIAQYLNL